MLATFFWGGDFALFTIQRSAPIILLNGLMFEAKIRFDSRLRELDFGQQSRHAVWSIEVSDNLGLRKSITNMVSFKLNTK